MKKVMFIGATLLLGMMMIAAPADAQSRKDKKAAKKAEWQFEQQRKEMERQRVLDSIKTPMLALRPRPQAPPSTCLVRVLAQVTKSIIVSLVSAKM